ncbi:hypothetical protein [Shewanella surugensis]|uniref:DUF2167 domain-containing protein n=1 Tax=Shewanella surugensis TaxID=212020 RepID=A0ABT0LJ18_9GAMM|nr:hypothetical protein [Shewanella surugensis]MCL1127683.1 hypothetical protein [Shewanella surugensis]
MSFFYIFPVQAVDLYVEDYYIGEDVGLFFTRSEISDDIVYYIPNVEQSVRATGIPTTIDGERYLQYEAKVNFPDWVDLDAIRAQQPQWNNFGFMRGEVEVIDTCEVKQARTDNFHYYQRIDDVWKRSGSVSTSEAIFCLVSIAIKEDDSQTLAKVQAQAAQGTLIAHGIDSFNIIAASGSEVKIDLTLVFQQLQDSGLWNINAAVSQEMALTLMGIGLNQLSTAEMMSILSEMTHSTEFMETFLQLFFVPSGDQYLLEDTLVDPILELVTPTSFSV